ncbi:MAG: hypothetical protein AAFX93_07405 [Verrucomicrobiota bacterium]
MKNNWSFRIGRALLIAGTVAIIAGCSSVTVRNPETAGAYAAGTNPETNRRTVDTYFWGSNIDPEDQPFFAEDAEHGGIHEVVVHRNWGNDLISVLSLGFWQRTDIEYVPATQDVPGGDFPE